LRGFFSDSFCGSGASDMMRRKVSAETGPATSVHPPPRRFPPFSGGPVPLHSQSLHRQSRSPDCPARRKLRL